MGYSELIEKLQALPMDKRDEVFDFVEFLAAGCGAFGSASSTVRAKGDWSDTKFSDFSMGHALHGMESAPVIYTQDDLRECWQ
ncbi:MAG: hypothetical protein WCJ64_12205 [Rhodospirillaceae bacterium]